MINHFYFQAAFFFSIASLVLFVGLLCKTPADDCYYSEPLEKGLKLTKRLKYGAEADEYFTDVDTLRRVTNKSVYVSYDQLSLMYKAIDCEELQ